MLQTRKLTRHFAGVTAVSDVDIDVAPREIFGIIGPNGAGKTTFFNLLSGVMRCSAGEIRFKGESIHELSPHAIARRGIGRTFQIVRPFSDLSVLENVLAAIGARHCTSVLGALGRHHRRAYREEARAILARVGLAAIEDEVARNLPLGMLRRLEIGRALGLSPALILLDESFSGLSFKEASVLVDLVRALRDDGMTVVLIEHNMHVTMSLCDRLAVLDRGEKIAEGAPDEIKRNERVVAAYLGSADA